MSRPFVLLTALVLSLAACGDASTSTTTGPTTTTAPGVIAATTTTRTETTITTTTTTRTSGQVVTAVDIVVVGGTVDGAERFDVPLNGAVRVTVTADVSDEIHVHGYDLRGVVTPDQDAILEFEATIPGIFEIELEGSGVLIGELQVAP